MAVWKRDIASGLIVLVPIIVTTWVVYWLFRFIAGLPVTAELVSNAVLRVVMTLGIFALFVFAIGYLMRTTAGVLAETAIDDMMNQVPGLRVVYNASKMAIETALTGTNELQAPVKIEVWDNIRMTAFKTGKQTNDGKQLIFMPTAPNPASGFVIEVDDEDLIEIDESVETALTRIVSAGFGEQTHSKQDTLINVIDDADVRQDQTSNRSKKPNTSKND